MATKAALDKAEFEPVKRELEDACFAGNTLVLMENDELKEIRSVCVGDKVLSRNEITGEVGFREVVEKFEHEDVPTYDLFFYGNVPSGNKKIELPIVVTAAHRFWVEGQGWTALIDLRPGDVIPGPYGGSVTVHEVSGPGLNLDVYNLAVDEFHTYFVDVCGLWVHNTKKTAVQVDELPETTPDAKPHASEWLPERAPLEAKLAEAKARLQ